MNNYLIWQLMKNFNMALSKQYREVDQILQRALTGANIREERWRECITDVDNVLGFAIGAQFVNQTFDNGTKSQAKFRKKSRWIIQITLNSWLHISHRILLKSIL